MEQLFQLVKNGKNVESAARVKKLLDEGIPPDDILKKSLIPAMDEVGKLFSEGTYFLPEMLFAARAMEAAVAILQPILAQSGIKPEATVVIGTVRGDMHDIGKNLVRMGLEGGGFEVIDLGVDVPEQKFVEAIETHKPIALALSALLTTTMSTMQKVIAAIESAGLRDKIKIMVGGAPLTDEFANEIGADFYGADPVAGKDFVKSLL
jgi:5-methyltetrahydrofolate--homocysteine methyltransferase